MSKIYFSEVQRIDQLWMKLLMAGTALAVFIPFMFMDQEQLFRVETLLTLMGLVFALVFSNIVIFAVKFETKIMENGILYKYPPIVWKWTFVAFADLEDFKIRTYSAWREFGGLGYKSKLFRKHKAIIIKGDQGLELTFKNGKKLLLGTQKPDELKVALRKTRAADSEQAWRRKEHLH